MLICIMKQYYQTIQFNEDVVLVKIIIITHFPSAQDAECLE